MYLTTIWYTTYLNWIVFWICPPGFEVLLLYLNVFDHVYLKFLSASYLYLIQKPKN